MKVLKNMICFFTVLWLLFGIFTITNVKAELNLNDIELNGKGRIKYRFESYDERIHMIMNMTIEFKDLTTITEIEGENVEVYQASISGDIELMECSNQSSIFLNFIEENSKCIGILYFPKTGKINKNEFTMDFQLSDETYDLILDSKTVIISINEEIIDNEPDDIKIGDAWIEIEKSEEKVTTYTKITGMNFSNTDTDVEWDNKTETNNYECIGEETVTVPAGTYDTYVIKKARVGENKYSLYYQDKETGLTVKKVEYDKYDVPTNREMVLISNNISLSLSNDSNSNVIPGFEIIIMIFAVVFVTIWRIKKKIGK